MTLLDPTPAPSLAPSGSPIDHAHADVREHSDRPDQSGLRALLDHLAGSGADEATRRATLAHDPSDTALAAPDLTDPLVLDPHVTGEGRGPLAGLRLEADDLVPLDLHAALPPDATVLVEAESRPVMMERTVDGRTTVTFGSRRIVTNRWLAAADNAIVVAWALTGRIDRQAADVVRRHRPTDAATASPTHAGIVATDNADDHAITALLPDPSVPVGSAAFLRAAGHAGRLLSAAVHDALSDFADEGAPAGAIVLRGMPVGHVPETPRSPLEATDKDHASELTLLTVARRLGHPIGYAPEHGGDIVQNLLPTRGDVGRQTSTSSGVELEFHTETAFHRHKPRFLLLLCLRGDPRAETLLCSISQVLPHLPLGTQQVLREPRFRTGVDESFSGTRSDRRGHLMAALGGPLDAPTLTFDADLMTGVDADASDALDELRRVIRAHHVGVALEAGDLLVVDNRVSVHGRSPFPARFDGTDRWIQRTFVVTDLTASATERRGRVVTTRFA